MNYKSHMLVSIGAGTAFSAALMTSPAASDYTQAAILIGCSWLGGFLPDIDHSKSKIGRAAPWLSWFTSRMFEHRGFTHSIAFMVLVYMGFNYALSAASVSFPSLTECKGYTDIFIVGIIVGALSHILADACTVAGVKILYPLPFQFRFPILSAFGMRTGSPLEYAMAAGLVSVFGACAYGYRTGLFATI